MTCEWKTGCTRKGIIHLPDGGCFCQPHAERIQNAICRATQRVINQHRKQGASNAV